MSHSEGKILWIYMITELDYGSCCTDHGGFLINKITHWYSRQCWGPRVIGKAQTVLYKYRNISRELNTLCTKAE